MYERQSGFTVIEVMIFLSITALLFLIAMFGTGSFVGQTRFTDGMRRLESYLQSQYDEVVSGVNPRDGSVNCVASVVTPGTSSPGTSPCVLIGKMVQFDAGSESVKSYYVVGVQPQPLDDDLPINDLIASFSPRAVDNLNIDTFESPWGITYVRSKRASGGPNINTIAFLRSPISSQVVTYIFNLPSTAVPLGPSVTNPMSSNTSANFCFRSADNTSKIAAIKLASGQGSSTISTLFETTLAASC